MQRRLLHVPFGFKSLPQSPQVSADICYSPPRSARGDNLGALDIEINTTLVALQLPVVRSRINFCCIQVIAILVCDFVVMFSSMFSFLAGWSSRLFCRLGLGSSLRWAFSWILLGHQGAAAPCTVMWSAGIWMPLVHPAMITHHYPSPPRYDRIVFVLTSVELKYASTGVSALKLARPGTHSVKLCRL